MSTRRTWASNRRMPGGFLGQARFEHWQRSAAVNARCFSGDVDIRPAGSWVSRTQSGGVLVTVAVLWMTEPVPLPVGDRRAMLCILLGVADAAVLARLPTRSCSCLSAASSSLDHDAAWLDRRLAMAFCRCVGSAAITAGAGGDGRGHRVRVHGSATATAAMMLPVGLGIPKRCTGSRPRGPQQRESLRQE